MKKFRLMLWMQLLMLPLIVFSSFSGCEEEEEDVVIPDVTGVMSYYRIPSNELNGWDEGFCYANESGTVCPYYIVSSTDSVNGDITVCLNETSNTDVEKSLIFHFSKDGNVLKILLSGYNFEAQSEDDKVNFVVYDTEGNAMGGFSVPYVKIDTMAITRSPFFNSKGEFSVSKTLNFADFMEKGANILGNAWNLSEGNYGEVVADFLLGRMTGTVKSIFARMFVPLTVKNILEWFYEEAKKSWMGDAGIRITSAKRTSETTITVEGEITDIYSIPLIYMDVTDDGIADWKDNVVRYGVAVGRNSYPGLYLNENCSELEVVSQEENFSFTFYMDETPGEIFYFRPFLVPESKLKGKDDLFPTPYTCIRYGEAKKFMDMDVELENFKRTKCVKNGGKYNVQFTIDGKIPGVFDDLANWGFDVKSKSGAFERRYLANESGSYSVPTEKAFTCDVEISESDIETVAGEQLAELTITPFVLFRNSLPLMEFYDEKIFMLKITGESCSDANHVHAIDLGLSVKWACCNVGASSPEEYGGYYAWGETEEKSDYDWDTYKYYNANTGCVNIGSNISGTQYDVAHVKWGGSWRMPTKEEIKELVNNCTWTWTTQNGVSGQLVTGPNGNSIFLPAAGGRYGTDVCYRGSLGNYWSATLYENRSDDAYYLYFYSGGSNWYSCGRYYGLAVRPVTE